MPSFVTDDPTCFFTFSSLRLCDGRYVRLKLSTEIFSQLDTWIPYKCACSIDGVASPRKAFWNISVKRNFMGILSFKSAISLGYNCRTHSAQTFKFQLNVTFVTATLATPIHNKPTQLHSVRLFLHATSLETICSYLTQALAKVLSGQPHCANSPEFSTHWQGKR